MNVGPLLGGLVDTLMHLRHGDLRPENMLVVRRTDGTLGLRLIDPSAALDEANLKISLTCFASMKTLEYSDLNGQACEYDAASDDMFVIPLLALECMTGVCVFRRFCEERQCLKD